MSRSEYRLELLRYRISREMEHQRERHQKKENVYLEAGQHIRSLNQILWQIPSMAIAITGGLWYGVTTLDAVPPKVAILLFSAFVNLVTILIILRLRYVMQQYIEVQSMFSEGDRGSRGKGRYIVVGLWSITLLGTATVGFLGACYPELLHKRAESEQSARVECNANLNVELHQVKAESRSVIRPQKSPYADRAPCK